MALKLQQCKKTLGEIRIISPIVARCGCINHPEEFNQQTREGAGEQEHMPVPIWLNAVGHGAGTGLLWDVHRARLAP